MIFIDTNIFLRFITGDNTTKAKQCLKLFQRIEGKEIVGYTSISHIAEVMYVLTSKKLPYQLSHKKASQLISPLVELPAVKLTNKKLCMEALHIYSENSFLDFEDAVAVAEMTYNNIDIILSYDKDFDRIEDIKRQEP